MQTCWMDVIPRGQFDDGHGLIIEDGVPNRIRISYEVVCDLCNRRTKSGAANRRHA